MTVKFEMPLEEKWVKQVFVGDVTQANIFFREICNKELVYRAIQIIGFSSEKVLISYEENINAPKESENETT